MWPFESLFFESKLCIHYLTLKSDNLRWPFHFLGRGFHHYFIVCTYHSTPLVSLCSPQFFFPVLRNIQKLVYNLLGTAKQFYGKRCMHILQILLHILSVLRGKVTLWAAKVLCFRMDTLYVACKQVLPLKSVRTAATRIVGLNIKASNGSGIQLHYWNPSCSL